MPRPQMCRRRGPPRGPGGGAGHGVATIVRLAARCVEQNRDAPCGAAPLALRPWREHAAMWPPHTRQALCAFLPGAHTRARRGLERRPCAPEATSPQPTGVPEWLRTTANLATRSFVTRGGSACLSSRAVHDRRWPSEDERRRASGAHLSAGCISLCVSVDLRPRTM